MYFRSHRPILLAALIFVACGTSQRELSDLRNTARTAILRGELPAARAAIDRGLAATTAGDKAEQAWAFRLLDAELLIERSRCAVDSRTPPVSHRQGATRPEPAATCSRYPL